VILELSHDGLRQFRCNYTEYRAQISREKDAAQVARAARTNRERDQKRKHAEAGASPKGKSGSKGKNKGAAKQQKAAPKASAKAKGSGDKVRNPQRFARLESDIMTLEEQREKLMAAMTTEKVYRDADALRNTQVDLAEVERDLESKNELWANWR